MDSRRSLPSNALIGGGNDTFSAGIDTSRGDDGGEQRALEC